jgi:hypothetical protein
MTTTSIMTMNIILVARISPIFSSYGQMHNTVAYVAGLQAKVNALRELQSVMEEELSALMPSILDRELAYGRRWWASILLKACQRRQNKMSS